MEFFPDNKFIFKHFFKVENMGKPYLKQVVKWLKNEAPEGLMQICVLNGSDYLNEWTE